VRSAARVLDRCLADPASILDLHEACRVYTREEVVAGLLDAIGWREDCVLDGLRLLEPASGSGVFVRIAAERLIGSFQRHKRPVNAQVLECAITAYEIHPDACREARAVVSRALAAKGLTTSDSRRLAALWIREADFITSSDTSQFTHIVGNPPYVRWSKIPLAFRTLYARSIPAVMQRGDLCVPFLYKSAAALLPGGKLAFVCSDRWLRANYGTDLRQYLRETIRTLAHIEIHDVPVFDRNVNSYASITIFSRPAEVGAVDKGARTLFGQPGSVAELARCFRQLANGPGKAALRTIEEPLGPRPAIFLREQGKVRALRKLEAQMPTLEESGCSIRVGAALGHTPAFVVDRPDAAIESALLLPYATSRDIHNGEIRIDRWLIDVFDKRGHLIDLNHYPGARKHLLRFRSKLSDRSCVSRSEHWYRTIDKISREFAAQPKILICGIARVPRLALATQTVQPGNSLYSITSSDWPLAAVFNVLSAGILGLFADAYSPRVNGGFLRFHGVVLGKVRLPAWTSVPADMRQSLALPESGPRLLEAVTRLYKFPKTLLDEYALEAVQEMTSPNRFTGVIPSKA
jgi:adenine-specific DNA-methyltransferase